MWESRRVRTFALLLVALGGAAVVVRMIGRRQSGASTSPSSAARVASWPPSPRPPLPAPISPLPPDEALRGLRYLELVPSDGLAALDDPHEKRTRLVHAGDRILDATVVSVDAEAVILERPGGRLRIAFEGHRAAPEVVRPYDTRAENAPVVYAPGVTPPEQPAAVSHGPRPGGGGGRGTGGGRHHRHDRDE